MKFISIMALMFAFLVQFPTYAQRATSNRVAKPKLGTGTVTGIIDSSELCADPSYGYICVSVGKYLLQLSIGNPRRTVISGVNRTALTPGTRVRVTYKNLGNSEQDLGYLFLAILNESLFLTVIRRLLPLIVQT